MAKHRLFVWFDSDTIPDHQLYVFAREDDYFFGVLHSRAHELWALRMGTFLGVGNDPRYTPTTCFETFPLPWPPGKEPKGDTLVEEIAEAAHARPAAQQLAESRGSFRSGAEEAHPQQPVQRPSDVATERTLKAG